MARVAAPGARRTAAWRLAAAAIAAAILVAGLGGAAAAQTLPTLTAPVNDFAHVVDAQSAAELDRQIRSLQSTTGDAVVIATIDTFAPAATIEEYAVKLFEQAKIGERGKDNGVLILVAVKDRRVKIEVGYGLEEFITDGFAGETIRQQMLPAFRNGQYGAGLLAGTTRVIQRIAQGRGVTLKDVPQPPDAGEQGPQISPAAIIIGLFVLFAIISAIRKRGGGGGPRIGPTLWGPWSGWGGGFGNFGGGIGRFGGGFGGGGGGFGGFGGFGGGRSGGGGASGGW